MTELRKNRSWSDTFTSWLPKFNFRQRNQVDQEVKLNHSTVSAPAQFQTLRQGHVHSDHTYTQQQSQSHSDHQSDRHQDRAYASATGCRDTDKDLSHSDHQSDRHRDRAYAFATGCRDTDKDLEQGAYGDFQTQTDSEPEINHSTPIRSTNTYANSGKPRSSARKQRVHKTNAQVFTTQRSTNAEVTNMQRFTNTQGGADMQRFAQGFANAQRSPTAQRSTNARRFTSAHDSAIHNKHKAPVECNGQTEESEIEIAYVTRNFAAGDVLPCQSKRKTSVKSKRRSKPARLVNSDSEDSSSDSDCFEQEKPYKQMSFPKGRKLKDPKPFNGTSVEWSDYYKHFQTVADWNNWTSAERAKQLVMSFDGEAIKLLGELSDFVLQDYQLLVQELNRRYDPTERSSAWKIEFRNRYRKSK